MSTRRLGSIVGLTGGIATGKSTVSEIFRDAGVVVIDADELARQVVAPNTPALDAIQRQFGDEVIDDSGELDRARLGEIVFASSERRAELEAITHPQIALAMLEAAREAFHDGHQWVIYDAALLVETGGHRGLDALIVVDCSPQTQRRRLKKRDGLSDEEIQRRLDAQLPLDEKREAADFVICNDGSLDDTRRQVLKIKQTIDDNPADPARALP